MTVRCDVTVVIPNYNRTQLLLRALTSVTEQTVLPEEVIVVDDCSLPEYSSIIASIVDSFSEVLNIRLLVNERNRGANYARNRGLFAASAKYTAFLDSDDLWMPEKLEKQLYKIQEAKQKDYSRPILSATGRYRITGNGNILARQFGSGFSPTSIKLSNSVGTLSSVIVETWIARHIRGFEEALPACQDWDFFIRLSEYVQFVGVADPLCLYVDHDEARITLNNRKRLRAHLYIYRQHLRSSLLRHRLVEFYRNVAEDLQELGDAKRARLFYSKSKALARTKRRFTRSFSERYWSLYYSLRNIPKIKEQRYQRYGKSMKKLLENPSQRAIIEADNIRIKMLLAR